MRDCCWQRVLVALLFGLAWMPFAENVRAEEPLSTEVGAPSVKDIESDLSRLNELWKAERRCEYLVEAAKVAERLSMVRDRREAADLAADLLEAMLPRTVKLVEAADYAMADEDPNWDDVALGDLYAMSKLANLLSDIYTEIYTEDPDEIKSWTAKKRIRSVKLAACFLGRVRMELDPHYEEKPTSLNVVPPVTDGQWGFAGMAPDAIRDPVVKAKYLSAIRDNLMNGMSNARQQKLRSLSAAMGEYLVNDLINTFSVGDNSGEDLAKCMKAARLTDQERKEVESALSRVRMEFGESPFPESIPH